MARKKALVVDNEKIMVEIVSGILQDEGFRVEKAYGGLEALEVLKKQKFDIAFLDLIMPRVGGDRICKFIKQSPEHSETKVVIVTACAIEADEHISEFMADACIAKSAVPKMRKNIINALNLLKDSNRKSGDMILGREGVHPRVVVQELLFSKRYFETIFNCMSEGVIELDTNHIITYVNPAAETILGKKEWDLIGKKFNDGFDLEKTEQIDLVLNEIAKTSFIKTKEMVLSFGNDRELSLSFKNVIREGELIGATVVVNDITEKKLLEKERYLRERLAGVIEMSGAAAHELNQPLAVISGHSQLLLKDSEGCDEKLLERVRIILEQVERLGELTKKFTNIVSYKTKEFGANIKIVDIERSSGSDDKTSLKGLWE